MIISHSLYSGDCLSESVFACSRRFFSTSSESNTLTPSAESLLRDPFRKKVQRMRIS